MDVNTNRDHCSWHKVFPNIRWKLNGSQKCLSQEPFTFLKIIEDFKMFLLSGSYLFVFIILAMKLKILKMYEFTL